MNVVAQLKRVLFKITPRPLVQTYRWIRFGRTWYNPRSNTVEDVFTEIYRAKTWNETSTAAFDSGPGSDPAVLTDYLAAVREFLQTHSVQSVADLGCGDFRVGERLTELGVTYQGVDVVPDLIAYHQRTHTKPGVTFARCNLITDELPAADLGLIRQVLQHLSNEQVETILAKAVRVYRHLIVTEHELPPDRLQAVNGDIAHGPETRLERGSHLALDHAPFHYTTERIYSTRLGDGTAITSYLVRRPPGT